MLEQLKTHQDECPIAQAITLLPLEGAALARAIRIWKIDLDLPAPALAAGWNWLGRREKQRADRFRTDTLRHRFIAAHAACRSILAAEVGSRPQALDFTETDEGKPELAAPENLQFNLSHSDSTMLLAISRREPVGVDVEAIGEGPIDDGLLDTCLTIKEQDFLRSRGAEAERDLFIRHWAAKEAVLKAEGSGLSIEPTEVELEFVADLSGGSARIACVGRSYAFSAVDAGAKYRAAVAWPNDLVSESLSPRSLSW